jgi:hypothetical protein
MGQTTSTAESPLFYDLPVAYYTGLKAPDLARRYSGATQLTRFTVGSALGLRPDMRAQAEGWARRGRLHMAVGYVGVEIGHLLVSLQVMERGNGIALGTIHNSDTVTFEHWDAHWEQMNEGEFIIGDVSHRTVRATESYNYTEEVPVLSEPVEGAPLAAVGSVGLRADNAFRRYRDQLTSGVASGDIQLQSVRFKPPLLGQSG